MEQEAFDYVVVGGGAAGCVVAARLALAGKEVLLLEAGDDLSAPQSPPPSPRSAADDYSVPAFHTFASEHPAFKWDFWVRHYADRETQQRDWKYHETYEGERVDGVLYPRASGLGGCAGHHAMIIMRPRNADWNHIWKVTGDASWKASNMQKYYRRIERCRYGNRLWRLWAWFSGRNPTGHGWRGWLTTERAIPLRTVRDWRLRRTLKAGALAASRLLPKAAERWKWLLGGKADPNDERLIEEDAWGLFLAPLSTARHVRRGPREFLLEVQRSHPNLTVRLNALVSRVEIDPKTKAAVAVHYLEGVRLYEASAPPRGTVSGQRRVAARREVILASGAFNSPQLLMLSGVGDPRHLANMGVETLCELPGVGQNLQDRYEICVVSRMRKPWKALRGAAYERSDAPYRIWKRLGIGPYTSNGALFYVFYPSRWSRGRADLCCFALLADFRGYYPRYSEEIKKQDYVSWVVLKAYTQSNVGTVRLRSNHSTERPDIQFNYFDKSCKGAEEDLDAVVDGVQFVRKVADYLDDFIDEEEAPGRDLYTREQLREYVRDNAWGHHACGTCAMKPLAQGGVVDGSFRVHGVPNLRVVDASIFPRIPGYFIVAAVYMIAEKAADVIIESAHNRGKS